MPRAVYRVHVPGRLRVPSVKSDHLGVWAPHRFADRIPTRNDLKTAQSPVGRSEGERDRSPHVQHCVCECVCVCVFVFVLVFVMYDI